MSPQACEVCGTRPRAWRLSREAVLWRCPECQHVSRKLEDCYAHARTEAWGGERDLDRIRLSLTYRWLRRQAPAGGSVFEVGYGDGGLLRRFRAAGYRIGGVDLGLLGRPVQPDLMGAPGIVDGRVEDLPPTAAYDMVYGVHVVEHVERLPDFLVACRGLLRPGGILVLMTPTADSHGPTLFSEGWWPLEDPTHVRFLSEESARLSLTTAGFEQVQVRRVPTDNLSMEFCSTVRRLAPRERRNGVLARRWVVAGAGATAPIALLARLADRRLCPTISITARRPAAAR